MKKWHGFIVSIAIIIIDQFTKHEVLAYLHPYQQVRISPMFNLTLAYNSGSAFSFLSDSGNWHVWFFTGFSLLMSVVLIIWMLRLPKSSTFSLIGLSMVLAGAIGNLIDRIRIGAVVDFIDVYYKTHHWPVFNVADSAICVGALVLCLNFDKIKT